MNNVLAQTDLLVEAIHSSSEYTQYQLLQNAIMKDEGVYYRLNEFRRRNFEIQVNAQMDAINESARLHHEYADVLNRPDVKNFLAAEQRYIKMLRKVTQKLDSQFMVNIDFLD
ncbi:MAG: YlbF family regulator [Lachnospiraceae bacterium]|jgi:cell fate (sporulation/competence/biofilm development) regulator YlbF (YheA/YmcA/DUF963 family)|nr:YlbF family regulator [Lachnospiraceae bacterium]MBQ5559492.1 YlbF family regulator [Lachnospiraceae bacterium]MCR4803693.1 YlbF family regulator [Lachnospiraceae bacterium]